MSNSDISDIKPALINPKQSRFIGNYLHSNSIIEACKKSKIRTHTFYCWKQDPVFIKALNDAQKELHAEIIKQATSLCMKALEATQEALNSINPLIKLRASGLIFNLYMKSREIDLLDKLERLEVRINEIERES